MQRTPLKKSKKTGRSFAVLPPSLVSRSDESPTINSTRFQRLPSGSLGSSTRHVALPPSTPLLHAELLSTPAPEALGKQEDSHTERWTHLDIAYLESLDEGRVTAIKRRKYNPRPIFLSKQDEILEELVRLEGRGDAIGSQCAECGAERPKFRCTQCVGGQLFCQKCIVDLHCRNPLHYIEAWVHDSYFSRVSLRSLGLRVQLGHKPLDPCRNPVPTAKDSFVVLDVNGIHEVALDFCECETAQPHFVQLLRYAWYPASLERPHTAATLNLLKFFELLNYESKASLFEFYSTLSRLSSNTGLNLPKDRYEALGEMDRQVRHLKSLKRAGYGHEPGGIAMAEPGGCAPLCPVCPHPGINLKKKWEEHAKKAPHRYALFLAVDGNFHLKRRNVSTLEADPSYGDGLSHFVRSRPYQDHIACFDKKIVQSPSTCSNHKAVNSERSGKGLAVTGVCAVDCARHDMKRPLAVGDFHHGERYVNVDYVFLTSLQDHKLADIVVSYDISCQWSVHLWDTRIPQYQLSGLDLNRNAANYRFLVPKFHLPAHISACQTKFSFNYARGVGRTDGEAPERGWARINPISASSVEMGPGHRQDMLDAHFRDLNWRKTTKLAVKMLKDIKEAVRMHGEFRFLHNRYTLGLPSTSVERWEKEVVAWEEDPLVRNPYEKRFRTVSEDAVRKRLIAEDKAAAIAGTAYVLDDDVSASTLITMGLDLEEQQRHIAAELKAAGKKELSDHTARFQNRVNILRRKIMSWIKIQHVYVKHLHAIRVKDNKKTPPNHPETPVESVALYLPSSLAPSVPCDRRLLAIEFDLRTAQANDALDEVRDSLRLRSHVYQDKDRFQRGQRLNLRSIDLVTRLDQKCALAASKYCTARTAVLRLAPRLQRVGQDALFPELAEGDIRGLTDDSIPDHVRKSQAYPNLAPRLSWIWKRLGPDSPSEDDALQDDLRIEFCKSRALCNRWGEEVDILESEMERGLEFFQWHSTRWTTRATLVQHTGNQALFEGKRAYALEQAAQYDGMKASCAKAWKYVPDYIALGRDTVVPMELVQEEKSREDEFMTSDSVVVT